MKANRISLAITLGTAIATSAGCANLSENQWANKENIGTLIGVTAGALLGSQVGDGNGRTAAIIAGALAGGYLGKTIGSKLEILKTSSFTSGRL